MENNKKLLTALFVLLLGLSPLLYVEPLHHPSDLPRYFLLGIVASLGILLLVKGASEGGKITWHRLLSLLALLVLWAALSSLWAIDQGGQTIEMVQLLGLFLVAILAAQLTPSSLFVVIGVSITAGSVAAFLGLLQNYGVNPFGLNDALVMGSTFTYKNHAALYLDLIAPISFFAILFSRRVQFKWLFALCFALTSAFLLISRTRGSWLAMALTLGFGLLLLALQPSLRNAVFSHLRISKGPVFTALLLIAVLLPLPGQIDTAWKRTSAEGQILDTSSLIRIQAYQNTLPMIADHPVTGVGLGSFRLAFRDYMNRTVLISQSDERRYLLRLHSDILQFFAELGIVGGVLWLGILIWTAKTIIGVISHSDDSRLKLLGLGILLSLVASVVHSLVDFPLHKPSSAIQFWALLGFSIALTTAVGQARALSLKKSYTYLLSGLGVVLLIGNIVFYIGFFQNSYYLHIAENAFQVKDCEKAVKNVDIAVQEFGLYWRTHTSRIDIYNSCVVDQEVLLRVLNQELAIEPTNMVGLLRRGDILLTRGDLEGARTDYSRVVAMLPQRAGGYVGMAWVEASAGDLGQANNWLNAALERGPDHPGALRLKQYLEQTPKTIAGS